jgi:tetratricopeptide (TPR) repeat protein
VKPPKDFHITDTDKEWVHSSFELLVKLFGYPNGDFEPFLFTDSFFPRTMAHKKTAIEPLIADCCVLFNIDPSTISFKVEEDLRDSHEIPFEIQGPSFECELEYTVVDNTSHFTIHFAKTLLSHPKRLVFNSIFKFIQIKLAQTDIEWLNDEQEHYFLFFLIGIYTGWGVILSQTMTEVGKDQDMFWQKSWKYISPMPVAVMAYSLALHSSMREEKAASWKNFLPPDIRDAYEKALVYVDEAPNPLFNKQELMANALFKEAAQYNDKKKFDAAIEAYQKVLFLTNDDALRIVIYNNIGYAELCKTEYKKSIVYFQKALELDPGFGYANDNLGFAFIMTGDTESGKHYLSIALQTDNNDHAYSYRNMALYHQKRGETDQAKASFQKAFENITQPVDFLEYFYARFLFEQGEREEARLYLQMAVEKAEPLAIQWMNELNL